MIVSRDLPSDGNISFEVYSAPSVEPVSIEELKLFARIDGNEEDAMLASFITAVRGATEEYLKRALIRQTIRAAVDFWPASGRLELPRPPLVSIVQIATRDEEGTLTVYDPSYYFMITEAIPGEVVIKKGYQFPTNLDRDRQGITIDFVCGYGDAASDVPEPIRQAIIQWAAIAYENRVIGKDPPPEAKPLLDLFRVERI